MPAQRCLLLPLLLLLLTLALAGCGNKKKVYISDKDNNTEISVDNDELLIVSLGANLSTGYEWTPTQVDASKLLADGSQYKADTDKPGAGGVQSFRYQTVGTGKTKLVLKYARDPKADKNPKLFTVSLDIR